MWDYLHDEQGMHISLMGRWLAGEAPFEDLSEFRKLGEKNFYFVAYP
jgi:hypothetical protein